MTTDYVELKGKYWNGNPARVPRDGWVDIIVELDAALYELYPDYKIHQIKEKFGGLRFYTDGFPEAVADEAEKLVNAAQARSYETCDTCGAPGTLRTDHYWIRTLCDKHDG